MIRHLAVSSLPMDDLMESVRWKPIYDSHVLIDCQPSKIMIAIFTFFPSMTLNLLRETGPVTLGEQVAREKLFNQTSTFKKSIQSVFNQLLTTNVSFPFQGRKSSFLDKLWRTNLKLPETPQTSLKRSVSREVRIISICFKVAFKNKPPLCLKLTSCINF